MAPPLAFVVILSMIKDAYEDYKRHKADESENNSLAEVFVKTENKFVMTQWKNIKVGDLVRVNEDQFFPADMIVLKSTENEGMFYVETKNLDGETNLKIKGVEKDLIEPFLSEDSLGKLAGTINIENPNNRIYKFDGNYSMTSGVVPLTNNSVALRGMSLRNTENVTGIVVYTGHDSKIQMNSTGATYKTSNIMRITNRQILYVFCIQIVCSVIGSCIGSTWMIDNLDSASYLSFEDNDTWNSTWGLLFIKKTGTWILIFT